MTTEDENNPIQDYKEIENSTKEIKIKHGNKEFTSTEIYDAINKERKRLRVINSFLIILIIFLGIVIVLLEIKSRVETKISKSIDTIFGNTSITNSISSGLLNNFLNSDKAIELENNGVSESELSNILSNLNFSVIDTELTENLDEANVTVEVDTDDIEQYVNQYINSGALDDINNILSIDMFQDENGNWQIQSNTNGDLEGFISELFNSIYGNIEY